MTFLLSYRWIKCWSQHDFLIKRELLKKGKIISLALTKKLPDARVLPVFCVMHTTGWNQTECKFVITISHLTTFFYDYFRLTPYWTPYSRLPLVTQYSQMYSGVQLKCYNKFSEKCFSYFDHHPKWIQKQMIPHLKALI